MTPEVAVLETIKMFLGLKSQDIVSGIMSNNRPIGNPIITTSQATPPVDGRPFITISSPGRRISISQMPPLSLEDSIHRVSVSIRNKLEVENDDDELYESASNAHTEMGDRIISEIFKKFKEDRFMSHSDSDLSFRLEVATGIEKINRGAAWERQSGYYVVESSEILFSVRSGCEETIY